MSTHKRLVREQVTLLKMIGIYCHHHHNTSGAYLCEDCQKLADYAVLRIKRCPFAANKPTCAKCSVHCYHSIKRQHIRQVMRYAGPRMLLHHPWLTILHLFDGIHSPAK